MCMGHTKKPTLNSECNYGVAGPTIQKGETIVYDEEGRCCPQVNGKGSTDYHSHHFRVFKNEYSGHRFAVKHGGGEESYNMYPHTRVVEMLAKLDSDSRYLMLYALWSQWSDGDSKGYANADAKWRKAAAEKRIKTRKMPGRADVKVWIEPRKGENNDRIQRI